VLSVVSVAALVISVSLMLKKSENVIKNSKQLAVREKDKKLQSGSTA
jgi:hypothetical protein